MDAFQRKYENGDVEFKGRERVEATLGKGAVFIGGHFSNWEITSLCLAQTTPPATSPIGPRTIRSSTITSSRPAANSAWSCKRRRARKAAWDCCRSLMKRRSVALMNDQKYNAGLSIPFFGHECMTADGPCAWRFGFKVPLDPDYRSAHQFKTFCRHRLRADPARLRSRRRWRRIGGRHRREPVHGSACARGAGAMVLGPSALAEIGLARRRSDVASVFGQRRLLVKRHLPFAVALYISG